MMMNNPALAGIVAAAVLSAVAAGKTGNADWPQ
jgi:hypothetical protein